MTITRSYTITGGDFDRGGSAASSLKDQLKRIGVEPVAIRRAMIAAYEAEMNVVIHAHRGEMQCVLDNGRLDVAVTDEGPGIADIELAMREGYSTAPPAARELGFGAGMGLPNIKRNSDRFAIESALGMGTRVVFTVYLKPEAGAAPVANSVCIAEEYCRGCLRCLFACPTGALRLREAVPSILEHLCVDCTACIAACDTGALTMRSQAGVAMAAEHTVLVLPTPFLVQFGAGVGPQQVISALAAIGYRDVIVLDGWERALRDAVVKYAREEAKSLPVISPVCGAVVNLIEMRYPALIGHLAPFISPVEAVREAVAGQRSAFLAPCPCEHTLWRAGRDLNDVEVIAPSDLRRKVMPIVIQEKEKEKATAARRSPPHSGEAPGILWVSGIRHVMRILEGVENGLLEDVEIIEPWACEQGCFGSPLWSEDPFIARHRWQEYQGIEARSPRAVRRGVPFAARAGLRLDDDMAKAIVKLAKIDELAKNLPGRNCGICGAPSCAAFAEDVVLGRADKGACFHLLNGGLRSGRGEKSE